MKILRRGDIMQSFCIVNLKIFWNITQLLWGCIYFKILCFEFIYFNTINKYITIHPIIMQTETKFFLLLSKMKTKIYFLSLLICTDGPISMSNIIKFLTNPLSFDNEKIPRVSNAIPYPECVYLSRLAYLISLIASNKEFPHPKSLQKLNGHKFIS